MITGTKHRKAAEWVEKIRQLCNPEYVYWCDGSEAEFKKLCEQLVADGTYIKLNEELRQNCYLVRTPAEFATSDGVETKICGKTKDEFTDEDKWVTTSEDYQRIYGLFDGCMTGRTMYVVPFSLGTTEAPAAMFGIQITDSPYVVTHLRILASTGNEAIRRMEDECFNGGNQDREDYGDFVCCLHSVGVPLVDGKEAKPWDCNTEERFVNIFPATKEIFSYGTLYIEDAVLARKCLQMKELMTSGVDTGLKYNPDTDEYTMECNRIDYGMEEELNPEKGYYIVAPGTNSETNSVVVENCKKNSIFTNVGLTPDNDVWWEGMDGEVPAKATDWQGKKWTSTSTKKCAHTNARICTSNYVPRVDYF